MPLYSIFPNLKNFAYIDFDRNEVRTKFGRNIKKHIEVSSIPSSYIESWQPLTVNFSDDSKGMTGSAIPDIMEFKGRLFLSHEAYEALKPLLENDGEFLPVTYEKGEGYIFNPLSMGLRMLVA